MFEDSTFESRDTIRTRSRGWMLATFALNSSILLALILIPLIYPEALPRLAVAILMDAPAPPPEPPKAQPQPANATVVEAQYQSTSIQAPSVIPKHIYTPAGPEALRPITIADMGEGPGSGSLDNPFSGHGAPVVVERRPAVPAHVSTGVMNGLILRKTVPVYPPIAKATRTQGTVELQATISKSGTIENLRVISGSPMLQQAALDAVQQWIYRPYLLNGQPVEVETTVNVVFRLD